MSPSPEVSDQGAVQGVRGVICSKSRGVLGALRGARGVCLPCFEVSVRGFHVLGCVGCAVSTFWGVLGVRFPHFGVCWVCGFHVLGCVGCTVSTFWGVLGAAGRSYSSFGVPSRGVIILSRMPHLGIPSRASNFNPILCPARKFRRAV